MAGWQAQITRWDVDEAEIRVCVDYYRPASMSVSLLAHHEEFTMPAGTPDQRVLEEIGKRGRAERLRQGKGDPVDHAMIGKSFPIDDL